MPSNVLQALYQQKYAEVITLIISDQQLVNEVDEKNGYSLFQIALEGSKPGDETQSLIEFLVTHKKFDPNFKNKENLTNIGSIISSARLDILKLVIKDPRFLSNGSQSTCDLAKDKLVIAENALQRDEQKSATSKASERGRTKVANLKAMVSMLNEATIAQQAAPSSNVATNNSSFFSASMQELIRLEEEKKRLEEQFVAQKQGIYGKAIDSKLDRVGQLVKDLKQERSSISLTS